MIKECKNSIVSIIVVLILSGIMIPTALAQSTEPNGIFSNPSSTFGIILAALFIIIVAVIWWYRTSRIKDREPDDRTRKGITHQD
ncbi:hypothetical protein GF319_01310 [Candidatus Bathyarchaeota archaeon]|nr:hypothetical protein [Candidatus Bathyarchaeota archaeon]